MLSGVVEVCGVGIGKMETVARANGQQTIQRVEREKKDIHICCLPKHQNKLNNKTKQTKTAKNTPKTPKKHPKKKVNYKSRIHEPVDRQKARAAFMRGSRRQAAQAVAGGVGVVRGFMSMVVVEVVGCGGCGSTGRDGGEVASGEGASETLAAECLRVGLNFCVLFGWILFCV